jgi:hypothetical protein
MAIQALPTQNQTGSKMDGTAHNHHDIVARTALSASFVSFA